MSAQEYYRTTVIKPDSVTEGTLRFLLKLRELQAPGFAEQKRNYRDSLDKAVRSLIPGFDGSPASFARLSPGSLAGAVQNLKLLSDLAWNNFLVSADKTQAIQALDQLQQAYPTNAFITGNYALALEILQQQDSAIALLSRYNKLHPDGYTPLDVEQNILVATRADSTFKTLQAPANDSFRLWVTDKLYKYPADLDSLRTAMALTILHRATAFDKPDKILGELIYEFGDMTAKEKNYQLAIPFYDLALEYDPSHGTGVTNRKAVIAGLEKSVANTFQWASIIFAVPLLAFVIIIVGWIRNRRAV